MIQDAQDLPPGFSLTVDLCVIGAGAAGIALATRLEASGLRVLLVETGGPTPHPGMREDLRGEVEGRPFLGLVDGRIQSFGGTTRVWGAQCLRLDPIDFERRNWIPESGWPIGAETLAPFYEAAETFLDLGPAPEVAEVWRRPGITVPDFHTADLRPHYTRFTPRVDFSAAFGQSLRESRTTTVLLNAPVAALRTDDARRRIERLDIRRRDGAQGSVEARFFVLAAGGIENARLLLDSDADLPAGLGNEHGLVGRYLQEHPTALFARLETRDPRGLQRLFGMRYDRRRRQLWPKLALAEQQQRARHVANCNVALAYEYDDNSTMVALREIISFLKSRRARADISAEAVDQVLETPASARDVLKWFRLRELLVASPLILREAMRFAILRQAPAFQPSSIWLKIHLEQAPDPESRVMLSRERDAAGQRRAKVAWKIGAMEHETVRATYDVFRAEFGRLGLADVVPADWLKAPEQEGVFEEAFHHMGTTRMAQSAAEGVVDTDCRLHDCQNLFVAGSSVFPTSGYCNPTLTIIALAFRLAEHLRDLSQQRPPAITTASPLEVLRPIEA